MSQVQSRQQGDIVVITMDNPPVNGLGKGLRVGLQEALKQAMADPATRAVVLTGTARAFSGGADIREFNTPDIDAPPHLLDLIDQIETATKPVVAAIAGLALGGGCELALACHYRVGAPGTQIGLPEVNIGLLPGAGGTQRLPRVLGVAKALEMIVSGAPIKAEAAAKLGFFVGSACCASKLVTILLATSILYLLLATIEV